MIDSEESEAVTRTLFTKEATSIILISHSFDLTIGSNPRSTRALPIRPPRRAWILLNKLYAYIARIKNVLIDGQKNRSFPRGRAAILFLTALNQKHRKLKLVAATLCDARYEWWKVNLVQPSVQFYLRDIVILYELIGSLG